MNLLPRKSLFNFILRSFAAARVSWRWCYRCGNGAMSLPLLSWPPLFIVYEVGRAMAAPTCVPFVSFYLSCLSYPYRFVPFPFETYRAWTLFIDDLTYPVEKFAFTYLPNFQVHQLMSRWLPLHCTKISSYI